MKRINEVGKLVVVSKRTLQYYNDEGLIVAERTKVSEGIIYIDSIAEWRKLMEKNIKR